MVVSGSDDSGCLAVASGCVEWWVSGPMLLVEYFRVQKGLKNSDWPVNVQSELWEGCSAIFMSYC